MDKESFVPKIHRKKPHLKPMPRHIQRSQRGEVGDPIPRRACLCRSEIADGFVRPDHGCHPCHHEDRAGQYHLQHAPLSPPEAD